MHLQCLYHIATLSIILNLYFIRYLYTLKRYVSNKAFPEGSIAEGYIAAECLTFCSMYLHGIETKFNRVERNYDGSNRQMHQGLSLFSKNCRPLGKGEYGYIDDKAWEQARIYVLKNCDEVLPFLTYDTYHSEFDAYLVFFNCPFLSLF